MAMPTWLDAEGDEVGIGAVVEPASLYDKSLSKIAEMGDGAAEGGEPEAQEGNKDLQRCAGLAPRSNRFLQEATAFAISDRPCKPGPGVLPDTVIALRSTLRKALVRASLP